MNRFALLASTITLLVLSCWVVAMAQPDQMQACVAEGHPTAECAACLNPSRGGGTAGSTAVCLCQSELERIGQAAFDTTYGSFGGCLQVEHQHGIQ